MRRRWSIVIIAALALALAAAIPADAGGKKSVTISDGWSGTSDCSLSLSFAWENYGGKLGTTYTGWLEYWFDDMRPLAASYESDGTSSLGPYSVNLGPTTGTSHSIQITYRLTKNGDHPRVVFERTVTHTTFCTYVD
jgi:hypothetical protein